MTAQRLAAVFVELADTLADDFDPVDFLHQLAVRCVQVLEASAAGVLLAGPDGVLRPVAASTEQTRLLELLQVQVDQGPCAECFHTGQPVAAPDLSAAADRWPRFVDAALSAGYTSVHALPMRLRRDVIGALSLFATGGGLDDDAVLLGQALADVATIGLLQARTIHRWEMLADQLQSALSSRIIIEQAKGIIAERHRVDMERSFALLRGAARGSNRRLSDLARAVVEGLSDRTA